MSADDPVDDRKTEAGALADGLGGEEWVEDAIKGGAIHAAATVADGEANVATFPQVSFITPRRFSRRTEVIEMKSQAGGEFDGGGNA